MEAQQYRYCTSADGKRLAYTAFGSGPPLLVIQRWAMGIDLIWRHPEVTAFYEQLASFSRVITFDRRGQGASARDVDDISMDRHIEDVVAVAEAAGLAQFDIFGDGDAAAMAVELAARHPGLVSHVIAWDPSAVGRSSGRLRSRLLPRDDDEARALSETFLSLMRTNWFAAASLIANLFFPSGPTELMHRVTQAWTKTISGEMSQRYSTFIWGIDVRETCARVSAPALVIRRRGSQAGITTESARVFAAALQNAEYIEVSGDIGLPAYDGDETVAAIRAFLTGTKEPAPRTRGDGTTIILFADIVESTELTERIGDAAFRERARTLDASLRAVITEAGGAAVEGKLLGDGVLATFPSASNAIGAACKFAGAAAAAQLQLHVGLHAGDVIREEHNVFGGAVNIASRISALSPPGEVLVSDVVRGLARTSAGVTFEDRGEHALKGIADAVRVYAVRTQPASPA